MKRPTEYALRGYDKDTDVYETLCTSTNLNRLKELGAIVMQRHLTTELRSTSNEPFDWFVIENQTSNIIWYITSQAPNGQASPF